MSERRMTCIECPRGCQLAIDEQTLTVKGNMCPKGEAFAKAELVNPLRILTTTVRITAEDEVMLPVRTLDGIPKGKMFEAMEQIKHIRAAAPVEVGDIVCENLAGTGVPLIATKKVSK